MKYAKIDSNHHVIVNAFRKAGATVQSLASVGKGVPDLLIGFQGENLLVEVKDGAKPPSERKLTADQVKWHEEWKGHVYVVNNEEEALLILKVIKLSQKMSQVLGDDF